MTLGLAGAAHASDDPNPYFVGATESVTRDSNVYRVPSDVRADTYTSTGLQGGIDQPFGAQRFHAVGNVLKNRFHALSTLDNTSYGLDAGLDWVTVGSLSGTLGVNQNQSLATYATTNQLALTARNIQRLRQTQAELEWGQADAVFGLQAGYTQNSVRYSAVEYAPYENDQSVVHAGFKLRPSGLLTLGAALRRTEGAYPAVLLPDGQPDRYHRHDVDLTALWIPTGSSTVNGRLSLGRQKTVDSAAQGVSSTTGSLQWIYTPAGKLSFDLSVSRDTGQNTTFQTLSSNGATAVLSSDNSVLTTLFALNATYAMTGKVTTRVAARLSRRSLAEVLDYDSGAATASAAGHDRIGTLKWSLTYLPLDSVSLSCEVGREMRSVSAGTPTYLSYPYAARTATCTAQINVH